MTCYFYRVVLGCLDIDTHWMLAHGTSHRLMAAAQTKMDILATLKRRFAMRVIDEYRSLIYALL